MKMYNKPEIYVTEFEANTSVSACSKFSYNEETNTYDPVKVYCVIGGQEETVFSTACQSSSSKHGIIDNAETYYGENGGITANGSTLTGDYFVWYTGSGDTGVQPSKTQTNILDALVAALEWSPGPGYHYAQVSTTTSNTFYTHS